VSEIERSARPAVLLAMDPARTAHLLEPALLDRLAASCRLLDRAPLTSFTTSSARSLLAETGILLTGWGAPRIDAAVLDMAPELRLVAHAAGTVRYLVAPEVFDRGITVTHAAAANALPVAEFTLAAILMSNKRVLRFRALYAEARATALVRALAEQPIGNLGKVVGLIGASRVGLRVLELLRPFDLEVLLHDPYLEPAKALELGARLVPLNELLAGSDVVSLHAPALAATRHMLDRQHLALLRDGATLINTARGSLIDQAALERELVSGRIDAVIDVTEPEILPAGSPLYELPNVLLTPHIAGAMGLERRRLGELAVEEIERFVRCLPLRHAIDPLLLDRIA